MKKNPKAYKIVLCGMSVCSEIVLCVVYTPALLPLWGGSTGLREQACAEV